MAEKKILLEEQLKELIDFSRETDLREVVWEKNGTKISFHRSDAMTAPALAVTPAATPEEAQEIIAYDPLYIRSTMVGTFHRSDSADRPPLVVEGTVVSSGQPVGTIEAMKIMKDVVAPMPCRILKALVADGHAVEYGQPLFEVEREGSENV